MPPTPAPPTPGPTPPTAPPPFWKRLSANEWLTAIIAIASLSISIASYQVSADNRDTRAAIASITELAKASDRQAKALDREVRILAEDSHEQRMQTLILQRQANESIIQSTEARRQNAIAATALSDSNRPLINSIGAFIVKPKPGDLNLFIARVFFSNSGRGLAENVQFRYTVKDALSNAGAGSAIYFGRNETCRLQPTANVGVVSSPSASLAYDVPINMDARRLEIVSKSSGNIAVQGCLTYQKAAVQYRTKLCFIVMGRHSAYNEGGQLCADGNEAN